MAAAVSLVLLLSSGSLAWGAKDNPRTLTKVSEIRALSAAEAGQKLPLRLKGVITFAAPEYRVTFFQDDTAGIYLFGEFESQTAAGSLVEVYGNTTPGEYAPSIENATIRVLGRGAFPAAPMKSVERLLSGGEDSQWVAVQGVVHAASIEDRLPPDMRQGTPQLVLQIAADGHQFKARIRQYQAGADYRYLVGATVTVRGACGTLFNSRRQLTGVQIFVPTLEQLAVDVPAPADRYASPVSPISSVLQFNAANVSGRRMHVRGVVTLRRQGIGLVAQDGSGGVVIETAQAADIVPGDLVDAVGFPAPGRYVPILQDGDFRKIGKAELPAAVDIDENPADNAHDAELVRVSGVLLEQMRRADDLILTMQHGSIIFAGQISLRDSNGQVRALRAGSQLRMTGVWSVETDDSGRPAAHRLLLRTPADIVVLQAPAWWTRQRVMVLLGFLAGVILLILVWAGGLRRRVDEKTEALRGALESTADGILVVDSNGAVVACNRKYEDMFRIREDHLEDSNDSIRLAHIASQLKDPRSVPPPRPRTLSRLQRQER